MNKNKYKIKAKSQGSTPVILEFTIEAETMGEAQHLGYHQLKKEGFRYARITHVTKL